MANPVNWFEIPVKDIERGKKFYEEVLGLELSRQKMDDIEMAWFPMEEGGAGATGSLVQAESYNPSYDGSVVYFSVADIESTLAKAESNGGKVVTPKMDIGEYGFIGHFEDSEGNRIGLHTNK